MRNRRLVWKVRGTGCIMRLIFVPSLLVVADPTVQQAATLSIVSFTVAFVLHYSVAEVWIPITRKSGVPKVGAAKAA